MTDDRIAAELAGLGARVEGLAEVITQRLQTAERDLARVEAEHARGNLRLAERIDEQARLAQARLDQKTAEQDRRLAEHGELLSGLERLRQRIYGGAIAVGCVTGVVGGTAGAWIVRIAEGI